MADSIVTTSEPRQPSAAANFRHSISATSTTSDKTLVQNDNSANPAVEGLDMEETMSKLTALQRQESDASGKSRDLQYASASSFNSAAFHTACNSSMQSLEATNNQSLMRTAESTFDEDMFASSRSNPNTPRASKRGKSSSKSASPLKASQSVGESINEAVEDEDEMDARRYRESIVHPAQQPIHWNYEDYFFCDHRVKLFCELTICEDSDENILLIAKVRRVRFPDLSVKF